jgi:hypothetical protein
MCLCPVADQSEEGLCSQWLWLCTATTTTRFNLFRPFLTCRIRGIRSIGCEFMCLETSISASLCLANSLYQLDVAILGFPSRDIYLRANRDRLAGGSLNSRGVSPTLGTNFRTIHHLCSPPLRRILRFESLRVMLLQGWWIVKSPYSKATSNRFSASCPFRVLAQLDSAKLNENSHLRGAQNRKQGTARDRPCQPES